MTWAEIHETHDRLDKYAEDMSDSMQESKHTICEAIPSQRIIEDATEFGLFDTKEAAEQMLSSRIQEMSLLPKSTVTDTFISDFVALHTTLQSSTSIPLLSLIAQNSFTHALEVQGNLIQHALLNLFFRFDFRKRLATIHSYFLFGNGIFVTRLREALFEDFDSEDGRSGGQPGLGLGIGLLMGKDVWPPSGAKVGLVLRNLLQETLGTDSEVSFAYRALNESDFEKVKNPIGKAPFPHWCIEQC